MGTWGAGLYSDDFALDLRSAIKALCRLPFDGDAILDELRRDKRQADDPEDEEYTTFWLVAAHQLTKRGVPCDTARERALEIIRSGRDLAMQRELGASAAMVRARGEKLAALAEFLQGPAPNIRRKTLSEPEALLLSPGSLWCFPTRGGKARNPYYATAEAEGFVPDGWGAMLVIDAGRAFGWLAWYAVVPLRLKRKQRPKLRDAIRAHCAARRGFDNVTLQWTGELEVYGGPGTLSPVHFGRLGLEHLGAVELDRSLVPAYLTEYTDYAAVNDISISNRFLTLKSVRGPAVAEWVKR